MRKLAYVLLLVSACSMVVAQETANAPLRLKDGSYLFVNKDGNMRMVDKDGKPVSMKDGVEMELDDGSVIMMQNGKVWRWINPTQHW